MYFSRLRIDKKIIAFLFLLPTVSHAVPGNISISGSTNTSTGNILITGQTVLDGDITGVIAGTNITGGASSGTATINLADPIFISSGTITTLNVNSIKYSNGSVQVSSPSASTGGGGGGPANIAVGTGTATNFTNAITTTTGNLSFEGSQFNSVKDGTTNFLSITHLDLNKLNGSTTTINGIVEAYPSSSPTGVVIKVLNYPTGIVTYQTAITDAARQGGINVMTATTTFDNNALIFQELSSANTPSAGNRSIYATSGGFFQKTSAGVVSQLGSGASGWNQTGSVISSTYAVFIGTLATSNSDGVIARIANGVTPFLDFSGSSSTFKNVTSLSINNVDTFTVSNVTNLNLVDAGTFTFTNTGLNLGMVTAGRLLATDLSGNIISTTTTGGGASLPLPPGDTNYIQVTNTLQSNGATLFVGSGTINSLIISSMTTNATASINFSTLTFTLQNSTMTSDATITATFVPTLKTLSQLQTLTPPTTGAVYYCSDCTTDGIVVSTGTNIGAFGRVSARTTVIQ